MRRVGRVVALAAVAALALAGCSSGGERPVTPDEADRLAEMLFDTYDAGGFTYLLTAQVSQGETVQLEGAVDFTTGVGWANVTASAADAPVAAIVFDGTTMLENIPSLTDALTELGEPAADWVARDFDSSASDLDALAGIVMGLGTAQRDNPELIQQGSTRWLRSDTLRDTKVDVFEYSPQARFWLEKDGTRLLRFEGNNAAMTRPVIVDVIDIQAVTDPEISPDAVVSIDDVQDIYASHRYAPTS